MARTGNGFAIGRSAAKSFAGVYDTRRFCLPSPRGGDILSPLLRQRGYCLSLAPPRGEGPGVRGQNDANHARSPETIEFARSRGVRFRLILEVDGADHLTEVGQQRDRVRDDFLNRRGYPAVRISRLRGARKRGSCRARIAEQVQQRMPEWRTPHPRPLSPRRGEGR